MDSSGPKLFVVALFIFSSTLDAVIAGTIDNAIIEVPQVECQSDKVMVTVKTKNAFSGRVFLKGNSHRSECVTDFGSSSRSNLTVLQVGVDYSHCNTERIRTLTPHGVTYANTVVIQFHKTFITKSDKVYNVRCFYAEESKTVAYNFDVSMISTNHVFFDMPLPQCSYTVRRSTPNGPVVRSANVGDVVFHRWECHTAEHDSEIYGMLVHSCFVEDTQGEMTKIVDGNGCALDPILLPNLAYNNDLTVAYRDTQVFKYPDHSFIHFKCQIRLCNKMDGGCEGTSPPNCGDKQRPKRRVQFSMDATSGSFDESDLGKLVRNVDVASRRILVLDDADSASSTEPPVGHTVSEMQLLRSNYSDVQDHAEDASWKQCFQRTLIIGLFGGFFVLFSGAFAFIMYVLYRNARVAKAHQSA